MGEEDEGRNWAAKADNLLAADDMFMFDYYQKGTPARSNEDLRCGMQRVEEYMHHNIMDQVWGRSAWRVYRGYG